MRWVHFVRRYSDFRATVHLYFMARIPAAGTKKCKGLTHTFSVARESFPDAKTHPPPIIRIPMLNKFLLGLLPAH